MANLGKKREDILRNENGSIDEEQLIKELSDYDRFMETLHYITYNVFGLGKLYIWSKEKVEKMWNKKRKEIIQLEIECIILPDVEGMETKEEIVEYLKNY